MTNVYHGIRMKFNVQVCFTFFKHINGKSLVQYRTYDLTRRVKLQQMSHFRVQKTNKLVVFIINVKSNMNKHTEAQSTGSGSLCPLLSVSNGEWKLYEWMTCVTIALEGWAETEEKQPLQQQPESDCGSLPVHRDTQPSRCFSSVSHSGAYRC